MKVLEEALRITNIPPDEDVINKAMYIGLHNDIQLKAFRLMIEMFPPFKIVAKILLKNYIKEYGP